MELRLMEAKHEANRTKEETERQAELEREVAVQFITVTTIQSGETV